MKIWLVIGLLAGTPFSSSWAGERGMEVAMKEYHALQANQPRLENNVTALRSLLNQAKLRTRRAQKAYDREEKANEESAKLPALLKALENAQTSERATLTKLEAAQTEARANLNAIEAKEHEVATCPSCALDTAKKTVTSAGRDARVSPTAASGKSDPQADGGSIQKKVTAGDARSR